MAAPIKEVLFWKRDINSIEMVHSLDFVLNKDGSLVLHRGNKERVLSRQERQSLFLFLEGLRKEEDGFRAYLYENNPQDYSLKFFLCIKLENNTYYAIKGRYPFKQKNYQEIRKRFNPFFEKQ